jgi:aquaglyceroporin related protein
VKKISWNKVPIYLLAQYLGGFIGTAVVYANYYNAIDAYDFGIRSAFGEKTSTGSIFTTHPNPSANLGGALLDQVKN